MASPSRTSASPSCCLVGPCNSIPAPSLPGSAQYPLCPITAVVHVRARKGDLCGHITPNVQGIPSMSSWRVAQT